jgi:predicted amidohydrolase
MKVALLQINPESSAGQNLQKAKGYIEKATTDGADIALLPELWNIGYVAPEEYPDSEDAWHRAVMSRDDEQFQNYATIAKDNSIAIALGYLEREGDKLYDSVALIDMTGNTVLNYRKVQTVQKNWEAMLTAGNDFPIVELQTKDEIVKIGCMICYDREFPEIARILMHRGAEIVLVPNACNLETNRLAQFQARAFENMMGVAMTNYPAPTYNGRSVAFDGMRIKGKEYDPTLVLASSEEGIFYADFDIEKLRDYRQREIWGDAYRKPWLYGELLDTKKSYPFIRDNAETVD